MLESVTQLRGVQLEAVKAERARVDAVRAELDEQLHECEVELAHKQTKLAELMAYVEKTNDQLTQLNAANIQLQTTVCFIPTLLYTLRRPKLHFTFSTIHSFSAD